MGRLTDLARSLAFVKFHTNWGMACWEFPTEGSFNLSTQYTTHTETLLPFFHNNNNLLVLIQWTSTQNLIENACKITFKLMNLKWGSKQGAEFNIRC